MSAAAGAAAGAAVGTAAEAQAQDAAPALIAVRAQALLIGLLRLVLAFAGLALAVARGLDSGTALELFVAAAGLLAFAAYAGVARRRSQAGDPITATEPLRVEGHWRALAVATYPSTIGLAMLTAIALGLNASLAAVLSGLLAGLAVLAFVVAGEIVTWDRRHGGRLLAERGAKGRVFVQRG